MFEELELAARRQAAEEKAFAKLAKARGQLILNPDAQAVFFSCVDLQLERKVAWDEPTMATDGRVVLYNPDFVNESSDDKVLFVTLHEDCHVALGHHWRMGDRDPELWNIACDHACNSMLDQSGFKAPADALMPGRGEYKHLPPSLSAEEYYSLLSKPKQPQEPGDQPGAEGPDPGGYGRVMAPEDNSPAARQKAESDTQVIVAQAANQAAESAQGSLPAGLARLAEAARQRPVDWREALREFVSKRANAEYSWARPNRRYAAQGLYLPGRRSDELGRVAVLVDTSGSIGQAQLDVFANELQAIVESHKCDLDILYHDVQVAGRQSWSPEDGDLKLHPHGGGGTSHVAAFAEAEAGDEPPVCIVALTDLYTTLPTKPPEAPVLWAVINNPGAKPPFGQVIHLGG